MQAIFPTSLALSRLAGGHGAHIPAAPRSRQPTPLLHQRHSASTTGGPALVSAGASHDRRTQPAWRPPRIRPVTTRQPEANLWGIGPLKAAATPTEINEDVLLDRRWGLQSRKPFEGPFRNVIFGDYGKREHKYLFTVDTRGINILREHTPFPTPRGMVVHTNISAKAVVAGECWFRPGRNGGDLATINAGSKRFPLQEPLEWDEASLLWRLPADGAAYAALTLQWQRVAQLWVSLGYEVEQIPLGQRFGAIQPRYFAGPAQSWPQPGTAADVAWLTRSPSCSRYAEHGARQTT